MNPKLSVLIAGVPTRLEKSSRLLNKFERLRNQLPDPRSVEVLCLIDNWQRTLGDKRQVMVELARGDYIIFCDDDDDVVESYLTKILAAAAQPLSVKAGNETEGPDVITFKEHVVWNGMEGVIIFGLGNTDEPFVHGEVCRRRPWHVCAWKRSIALQCKFPSVNWAEDVGWVDQAAPLAKTEVHIPEVLHLYEHYDAVSEAFQRHSGNRS